MRLRVLWQRSVVRLHQQREHTIQEELFIEAFITISGLVYWWCICLRHHASHVQHRRLWRHAVPQSIVWDWASTAWRQQMAGYFHKLSIELPTLSTKLEFPSKWRKTHKCYVYRHQHAEYAITCIVKDVVSSGYTSNASTRCMRNSK